MSVDTIARGLALEAYKKQVDFQRFDITPNGDDAGQTTELATLLNSGASSVRMDTGTLVIRNTGSAPAILINAQENVTLDLGKSVIDHRWDGINASSLATAFVVKGGGSFTLQNGAYQITPPVTTQGICVEADVTFKMAVPPDKERPWRTADNVVWVEPNQDGTVDFIDWQYAAAGPRSLSYDFLPTDEFHTNGWRIYEGSPQARIISPTSIASYNPLQFVFAPNTIVGDEVGTPQIFPTGLQAILNALPNGGKIQLSLDDENSTTLVTVYDTNGNQVDASTVSGEAFTGGEVAIAAVPYWMEEGQILVVEFRKRLASPINAFDMDGTLTFKDVNFRSACAAGNIFNCSDIVFDNCLYKSADGSYLSSTAGPFQIRNPRGVVRLVNNGLECWGVGDDPLNARTTGWSNNVTAYDVAEGWLDVTYTVPGVSLNPFPHIPEINDAIRFVPPGTIGQTVLNIQGLSVSPLNSNATRVSVGANLIPVDFDPVTWAVWNRDTAPVVVGSRYHIYGCGARGIILNTKYTDIDDFLITGTYGTPTRARTTSNREGGFEGNQHFGRFVARRCVTKHRPDANAVVFMGVSRLDHQLLDGKTGYPKNTIGYLEIDGCGYGGIYTTGVDLDVGSHSFTNMGTRRDSIGPADYPAKFDIWAKHSTIRMLSGTDGSDNFFEDDGGKVTFSQDETNLADARIPVRSAFSRNLLIGVSNLGLSGQSESLPSRLFYPTGTDNDVQISDSSPDIYVIDAADANDFPANKVHLFFPTVLKTLDASVVDYFRPYLLSNVGNIDGLIDLGEQGYFVGISNPGQLIVFKAGTTLAFMRTGSARYGVLYEQQGGSGVVERAISAGTTYAVLPGDSTAARVTHYNSVSNMAVDMSAMTLGLTYEWTNAVTRSSTMTFPVGVVVLGPTSSTTNVVKLNAGTFRFRKRSNTLVIMEATGVAGILTERTIAATSYTVDAQDTLTDKVTHFNNVSGTVTADMSVIPVNHDVQWTNNITRASIMTFPASSTISGKDSGTAGPATCGPGTFVFRKRSNLTYEVVSKTGTIT